MEIKEVLLIALLAIIAGVQGCPDEHIFQGTVCYCSMTPFISVTCDGVRSIDQLQKVVDDTLDYRFDELAITNSNLPYLNATWLAVKQVLKLRLQNTTLFDMFDRPSRVLSVKYLTMDRTVIVRGMRWSNYLKPFEELQSINLMSINVKKFGKEFRENVTPNLQYIYMQETMTSGLADGDFDGKNLVAIHVARGRIKVLKNSFFKDQKDSLTYLDFSYNPIESLPDDLFEGLKKLERFYLNNSKIKTLSSNLLSHASRYLMLQIEDNPFVCDCKMAWLALGRSYKDYIYGTCESPPNLKSKNLADLKITDFSDC